MADIDIERRYDILSGPIVVALGIIMISPSFNYGWTSPDGGIGPGFLPGLSGSAMLILGAIITFKGLSNLRAQRRLRSPFMAPPALLGAIQKQPVVKVSMLTLLAVALAPWVGFILSFSLLVFVLLTVVERRPIMVSGVYTVVASFLVWLVFVYGLNIPLPIGLVWG